MADPALAAVELGQRLISPCAVPTNCRAADQHGRTALQARDQTDDIARHPQARSENPPPFPPRPQAVGDRLAREIDDSVDGGVICDLIEPGDEPEGWLQRRRLCGVAGEHDDVMARARQSLGEPSADEAGSTGDEDALPAGTVLTRSAALRSTSRYARRAAKKSRKPNTITPAAASGASTVAMPYQTGTIAVGCVAQPTSTGTSSVRMAP